MEKGVETFVCEGVVLLGEGKVVEQLYPALSK